MKKKKSVQTTITSLKQSRPLWADGLKKLYAAVAAEPLPDTFQQLLDELEQKTQISVEKNNHD